MSGRYENKHIHTHTHRIDVEKDEKLCMPKSVNKATPKYDIEIEKVS